jgi:type II secretory pathway component PulF
MGGWQWIPGIGGAFRAAHWSRFAHLMAVLVESDVPLMEAAQLSAAAVGDRSVSAAISRAGPQLAGGQTLADALDDRCGMPPLLRWLMRWGEREATLAPALREAAAQYQQRALIRAELVARIVPLVIVFFVGGGITAVYALTVFVPLTSMWEGLANSG